MTRKSAAHGANSNSGSFAFDYGNALVDRRLDDSYRTTTVNRSRRDAPAAAHVTSHNDSRKSKSTR